MPTEPSATGSGSCGGGGRNPGAGGPVSLRGVGGPESLAIAAEGTRFRPGAVAPRSGPPRAGGRATRIRTVEVSVGRSPPVCSHFATARPTVRARCAATSAVSAGCTRLPVAKMPGVVVVPSAWHAGPLVPRSITRLASRASSLSGMKSPLNTTVSTATARSAPSGPRSSTRSTRVAPAYTGHGGPGPDGHPEAGAGHEVEEPECLRAGEVGDECHRADARLTQRQERRVGDVLCTHNEGSSSQGQMLAVHPLLELTGREDSRRPSPWDQARRRAAAHARRSPTRWRERRSPTIRPGPSPRLGLGRSTPSPWNRSGCPRHERRPAGPIDGRTPGRS